MNRSYKIERGALAIVATLSGLGSHTFVACGSGSTTSDGGALGGGGSLSNDTSSGGAGSGRASASGGTGGLPELPDLCALKEGTLVPKVKSITVKNSADQDPKKGDALKITLTIENEGTGVGSLEFSPLLSSLRFSDFTDVPLSKKSAVLCSGTTTVTLEGGPFLDREDLNKHYALGSGEYQITAIASKSGDAIETLPLPSETKFTIGTSGALLIPVIYDQSYFDEIDGLTTSTPEDYLTQAFTRPGQIFTPSSNADPDGAGTFQTFPGGFDEMMETKHIFRSFSGFPGESTTTDGWCEDAIAYGKHVLGMASDWTSGDQATKAERHGFDYLLALHPGLGGGVACGWIDVQVSSLINHDRDRQQVILVHESGHIFGAPHCDDVGNGDGGSLQGYVMCSGEKHANYPGYFVWHSTSRAAMSSKWD